MVYKFLFTRSVHNTNSVTVAQRERVMPAWLYKTTHVSSIYTQTWMVATCQLAISSLWLPAALSEAEWGPLEAGA